MTTSLAGQKQLSDLSSRFSGKVPVRIYFLDNSSKVFLVDASMTTIKDVIILCLGKFVHSSYLSNSYPYFAIFESLNGGNIGAPLGMELTVKQVLEGWEQSSAYENAKFVFMIRLFTPSILGLETPDSVAYRLGYDYDPHYRLKFHHSNPLNYLHLTNPTSELTLDDYLIHAKEDLDLDDGLLHLQFIQGVYNIITGRYPCSLEAALVLGGLHFARKFGKFCSQTHHVGFLSSRILEFIPAKLLKLPCVGQVNIHLINFMISNVFDSVTSTALQDLYNSVNKKKKKDKEKDKEKDREKEDLDEDEENNEKKQSQTLFKIFNSNTIRYSYYDTIKDLKFTPQKYSSKDLNNSNLLIEWESMLLIVAELISKKLVEVKSNGSVTLMFEDVYNSSPYNLKHTRSEKVRRISLTRKFVEIIYSMRNIYGTTLFRCTQRSSRSLPEIVYLSISLEGIHILDKTKKHLLKSFHLQSLYRWGYKANLLFFFEYYYDENEQNIQQLNYNNFFKIFPQFTPNSSTISGSNAASSSSSSSSSSNSQIFFNRHFYGDLGTVTLEFENTDAKIISNLLTDYAISFVREKEREESRAAKRTYPNYEGRKEFQHNNSISTPIKKPLVDNNLRNKAATKIQALFRGFILRYDWAREDAALLIQSVYRGYRARVHVGEMIEEMINNGEL